MPRPFRSIVLFLVLAALLLATLPLAAEVVCPRCGAPVEPGSAFCVRCGQKLSNTPVPAPRPEPLRGVVQVVTAHDSELTSTLGSLAYGSNLSVSSIVGTGFAVAPGEFVTDAGLVVGAKGVTLRTSAGRSIEARVIGVDSMIGVALLKAEIPEAAPLTLRGGAVGFPSGSVTAGEPVSSAGVLSGRHRGGMRIHPIEDYLQTDASLPRGLAGGPMLDLEGRVVGMSTGLVLGSRVALGPETGIGYAIPAAWVGRALEWIRSGAPERGWLGLYAVPADDESRARGHLPSHCHLVNEQVFPGSPAAAAGVRRGEGLLTIAGEAISSLPELYEKLLGRRPGESVTIEVADGAQIRSLTLTLAPRPASPRLNGLDALRFFADVEIVEREGKALVVTTVLPASAAARARIAAGDVLQSVLSKKDWEHGAKDNSRWRSVRTAADLAERLDTAYSDLDFFVGLRFRGKDGARRELYLWDILASSGAL